MPDLVVDYDMSKLTYSIVHQEEVNCDYVGWSCIPTFELTKSTIQEACSDKKECARSFNSQRWKDFSQIYCCQREEVISHDGVMVPLTIVYSRESWKKGQSPGLLVGYGAYGEDLDKSWCSERLSLLERGWVVAFADVRLVAWHLFLQFSFLVGLSWVYDTGLFLMICIKVLHLWPCWPWQMG